MVRLLNPEQEDNRRRFFKHTMNIQIIKKKMFERDAMTNEVPVTGCVLTYVRHGFTVIPQGPSLFVVPNRSKQSSSSRN